MMSEVMSGAINFETLKEVVHVISQLIASKDAYIYNHNDRVAQLALVLAQQLGLPVPAQQNTFIAALLHDVGKLAIPSEILHKPGALIPEEVNLMRLHCEIGCHVLASSSALAVIGQIVFQHHERWQGQGYPRGLAGSQIMLEAQIVGVSDVMESMVTHRAYREARSLDQALQEISGGSDILYHPRVAGACLTVFKEGFVFVQGKAYSFTDSLGELIKVEKQ
jgi:HD-GYP domain-containing protein (c-di-GMP phosphodiesterase class II)